MGKQRVMRARAVCADGCWVLNLDLGLRQAGFYIDQLLGGLHFDLRRGHQVMSCSLLLQRRGRVLFLEGRGTVERCRRHGNRRRERKRWDRRRCVDDRNHGDNSDGDLRRWERRLWVGRGRMRLLTVNIFIPRDVVGSDRWR